MKLITRIRWSRPPAARCDTGRPVLNLLPAFQQRGSLLPYIASAGLHVSFIAVALAITGLFPSPPETRQPKYLPKVTIIRFPKQEVHLKLVPESELAAVADRLRMRVTQLVSQLPSGVNSDPPRSTPVPKQLTHTAKQPKAILFQPEFALDLEPPPTSPVIPSALIWTKEIAQNAPERLVQPISVQQEVSSRELEAPPPRPAALIVDGPPAVHESPVSLPASRASAASVEKQTESKATATESRAVQLLSLSNAPAVADTILVPPGNLLPTAAASDGIRPGQTEGSAAASASSSSVPSTRDGVLHTAGSSSSNTPVTQPTFFSARAAVVTAEPVVAPQALANRLDHPVNGRFDVVVIQTSMDESVPPGLLNGKPIYTVYLPVGDTKEWVMHYCANQPSVVQRGAIVQLPDPRPLDAPYPRLTFRPAEPITGSGPYVWVYGVVDESGSFQNLRVIGLIQSGKSSLLEALGKWRFRPAMRAGSPALVQMVLAIPVSKS